MIVYILSHDDIETCDDSKSPFDGYYMRGSSKKNSRGGGPASHQEESRRELDKANLKNIFVSAYPTLFLQYGSVSRKIIFFNF